MSKPVYAVFRIYSRKEREDPNERSIFYGWSSSKNVVNVFLQQRDPKKYQSVKMDPEEVYCINDLMEPDTMIDFVKLRTAENHEEIHFYTTLREMQEAEVSIQERFHELCSIPDEYTLKMFLHLDPYYLKALELLGFRPKEVDAIYDTSDDRDNYNTLALAKDEIEEAYNGFAAYPPDDHERYQYPPGQMMLSNIGDKLIYSMENFVSALREDL